MAPQYKLTYFAVQALGEPIRFLLVYGNLDFEDYRINRDDWPTKIKPTTPFGKMPNLEFNGEKLHQHVAICRYLARILNLYGADPLEDVKIDTIVDTINDFRAPLHSYFYDQDPVTKAPKLGPIQKEIVPYYLGKFEEIVKKNGGYFVGNKTTWADVYFVSISEYLQKMSESDFFTNYPNLRAVRDRIVNLPQIKKWIQTRPVDA